MMRLLLAVALLGALVLTPSCSTRPRAPKAESTRAASVGAPVAFDPANGAPAGFTALFNGRDLDGWQGLIDGGPARVAAFSMEERSRLQGAADARMREHWRVETGELVFDGKGESLQSVAPFRDFELYADWRIEKGGDSGLYLRGTPQVQIWDNPVGSGGLFNNEKNASRPLVLADRPVGEWNRTHVLMRGDRASVWLNGAIVTDDVPLENYWDRAAALPGAGPIELQAHGTPLRFRNIFVREIADAAPTERDERMAWWREAKFGMFIHWGLYAIPAGEWNGKVYGGAAEWLMHSAKIPPAEWEPLAARFNPVKFDAGAWADMAREAGMRYVVITTKHHEGFSLFDTAQETYDVFDATPFDRDIMRELSDAVRSHGLRMGWYHSILDWHHPDYLPRREWDARPTAEADWARYVEHLRAQVGELLTKYGPIGVMWFDGEWEDTWTEAEGKRLYALCRELQPAVIVNNRVGKGREGMAGLSRDAEAAGDFGTPEQEVPATGLPGVDWESCMTMNDSWGFHASDTNWKSTETLIHTLVDIVSKDGNFLLNVGPTAEGEIPEASVDRLRAMGRWLEVNGESIYGCGASPFRRLAWGRATTKPGKIYLHVFDWPEDGVLRIPGLLNEVRAASFLDPPQVLEHRIVQDEQGVAIVNLPDEPTDPIDTVIVLDIAGEPAVISALPTQAADGTLTLHAIDATVRGSALYESREDRRCIGFWTNASDEVRWTARLVEPNVQYYVSVELACEPGSEGSTFAVSLNGSTVKGTVPATAGWGDFIQLDLPGPVRLEAGPLEVVVSATNKPGGAVMNLRAVRLQPDLLINLAPKWRPRGASVSPFAR